VTISRHIYMQHFFPYTANIIFRFPRPGFRPPNLLSLRRSPADKPVLEVPSPTKKTGTVIGKLYNSIVITPGHITGIITLRLIMRATIDTRGY